jgi:hypothetical protein
MINTPWVGEESAHFFAQGIKVRLILFRFGVKNWYLF